MFAGRAFATSSAILLTTAAVAACGGGDDPAVEARPTGATAVAATDRATDQPQAGAAVPAALDFTAPLVGGGEIEMGQHAGRPVLLWFWAPW